MKKFIALTLTTLLAIQSTPLPLQALQEPRITTLNNIANNNIFRLGDLSPCQTGDCPDLNQSQHQFEEINQQMQQTLDNIITDFQSATGAQLLNVAVTTPTQPPAPCPTGDCPTPITRVPTPCPTGDCPAPRQLSQPEIHELCTAFFLSNFYFFQG